MKLSSTRSKAEEIFEQSCAVIPGGVNSPVRACKDLGVPPLVIERGEGETIIDVDGRGYIDFCMSWGALLLGHAHPQVVEVARQRVEAGSTFGTATPFEEALARKIVGLIPSIEKVRFVSTGTEATMTAVRLARGFTKRSLIIKFEGNYHGHSDTLLALGSAGRDTKGIAACRSRDGEDKALHEKLSILEEVAK